MPLVINTFKPLRQKSKIFATSPKGEALGIMLSTLNSNLILQKNGVVFGDNLCYTIKNEGI